MAVPRIPVSTGIELFYEEHGSGPPLILNGGLGWRWVWFRNLGWLSRFFRVIALESRGLGESDKPSGPYDVSTMATELGDVIAGLGIGAANLMGLSLGCDIALECALSFPWLVNRLVLIGARPGGPEQVLPGPEALARMIPNPCQSAEANLSRAIPNAFSPGWLEMHPAETQQMGMMSVKKLSPLYTRIALLGAGATWPGLMGRGSQVTTPVLLCHGALDQLSPVANGFRLQATLPCARLTLFNSGHMCQIEQSLAFNQVATAFLQGT